MNPDLQKETIYVDVEDDITSIIDKVKSSDKKIVALVLPKRAASLQSIVNMKLLNRTAQNSKKNIVLITKEQALLPLAGAAGVYVAPNLQTKPEIPPEPAAAQQTTASAEAEIRNQKPEEAVQLDNKPDETTPEKPEVPKASKKPKKKPKIPNFEKFRLKLILGGLAVLLLIAAWVLGAVILPKATVTLATDNQNIETDFNFTADTAAESMDLENRVLPATRRDFRATDSEEVAATGQRNKGKKADGDISLTNCSENTGSISIPEGTRVTSGNLSYVIQDDVVLQQSLFNSDDECVAISSETVDIEAVNPGTKHNIGDGSEFSVSGYPGVEGVNEDDIDGGTNNIVKVVTQQDVDKALNAIQARASDDAPDDLRDELSEEGYYPLSSTLRSENPVITTSPNVGDEAGKVTVTATTSYTMDGVKEQHLRRLIDAQAQKQIEDDKQKIQDYQLRDATITLRGEGESEDSLPLSLSITLTAGPELDQKQIKDEVAGKNTAEVKDVFEGREGVNGVEVDYSPFWVKKVPGNPTKVDVVVKNSSADE